VAVTVFGDTACAKPLASTMISFNQKEVCVDTPSGSNLGSMSATLTYQAGQCTPRVTKYIPITMCCLR
jgi:hypothetical protein